ncbi:MAG TPA: threonine/serine dehydratase [Acidimicrobiia bacterium]|nr:threonine/serine dehydratase [Acidimicrobiia bacterium]
MDIPTFSHVLSAAAVIRPYLAPTPLMRHPLLEHAVGGEIWIKHENHQPTGAFKVRGGVNLMSRLDDAERARGVISASTGNHGQSIAWAAQRFGVRAVICVPKGANPLKVAAIKAWGGEVVEYGRDFDDARTHCEELAAQHGYRYVHSGDEPLLIAGVATETLEIVQQQPDVDVIVVPVGGGSGAAGACIVARSLGRPVEVIGVQSEAAPAAFRSWQARRLVEDRMDTAAEGLATRTAFDLPQRILWNHLDDFVLVGEDDLDRATLLMLETTRNLVEPAGAAAVAAVLRHPARFNDKRVVAVCSGGNIAPGQLRALLERCDSRYGS